MLLLAALPVAAMLIFAVALLGGVEGADVGVLALALLTALVACIPLAIDQGRPPSKRRILLSMFSLFYLAYYVTPALTYYIPAHGPIDAPGMELTMLTPNDIAVGQSVALLGLLSMFLGHYVFGVSPLSRLIPRANRDWSPATVLGVAYFMILLGWVIQILLVVGLMPAALGSGVVTTIGSGLIYGNVLLTYAVLRHRSHLAFLTLCFTVPITSALGFFTGSKLAVVIAPTIMALTVILYRRRIRARWVVLAIVSLALIFPASYFVRDAILEGNTLSVKDALRDPGRTLSRVSRFVSSNRPLDYFSGGLEATGARLDGLGLTSVIIRETPSRVPYQRGRTLALFFVAFVPRILWPEKPEITIGQWITDHYGSGPGVKSATAPSTLGDYYLNFGLAGAVGGLMLLGVILRATHESLLSGQPTAPGLLGAAVILFQLTLRFEGNVAAQYAGTVIALVPILAVHFLIRMLAPPPNRLRRDDASESLPADAHLGA